MPVWYTVCSNDIQNTEIVQTNTSFHMKTLKILIFHFSGLFAKIGKTYQPKTVCNCLRGSQFSSEVLEELVLDFTSFT